MSDPTLSQAKDAYDLLLVLWDDSSLVKDSAWRRAVAKIMGPSTDPESLVEEDEPDLSKVDFSDGVRGPVRPPKISDQLFMECDTCRAKPGSPLLCEGCVHNRTMIENMRASLIEEKDELIALGKKFAEKNEALRADVSGLRNLLPHLVNVVWSKAMHLGAGTDHRPAQQLCERLIQEAEATVDDYRELKVCPVHMTFNSDCEDQHDS